MGKFLGEFKVQESFYPCDIVMSVVNSVEAVRELFNIKSRESSNNNSYDLNKVGFRADVIVFYAEDKRVLEVLNKTLDRVDRTQFVAVVVCKDYVIDIMRSEHVIPLEDFKTELRILNRIPIKSQFYAGGFDTLFGATRQRNTLN